LHEPIRCATCDHYRRRRERLLLAHQLLRNLASDFRVTVIEKRSDIGRGLAYHTGNPERVLNGRAANMSALPDDPEHFWRWLSAPGTDRPLCPDPYCFVPRRIYGDYIASLIEPLVSDGRAGRGLTIVQGECAAVSESETGVTATLADGTRHGADVAILATGHDTAISRLACHAPSWTPPSAAGVDRGAPVLILGTGLTMVDYVLSLLFDGHQGPIVAMSRRGLLSKAHLRVDPMRIEEAEVPFGTSSGTTAAILPPPRRTRSSRSHRRSRKAQPMRAICALAPSPMADRASPS
jgi:uncharacterized NAD(P)/FAD-binding protein YdhS